MLIKKLRFPRSLKDIEDIYDDNLDIFFELEDESEYTVIVRTPMGMVKIIAGHVVT